MEIVSGDSVDEKIKAFSDVLDKITQFAMNSIDQLSRRVAQMDQLLRGLEGRVTKVEQLPRAQAPADGTAPPPPIPEQAPAPKPAPKPMSPVSARAALQGELKALFAKRKRD